LDISQEQDRRDRAEGAAPPSSQGGEAGQSLTHTHVYHIRYANTCPEAETWPRTCTPTKHALAHTHTHTYTHMHTHTHTHSRAHIHKHIRQHSRMDMLRKQQSKPCFGCSILGHIAWSYHWNVRGEGFVALPQLNPSVTGGAGLAVSMLYPITLPDPCCCCCCCCFKLLSVTFVLKRLAVSPSVLRSCWRAS